MVNCSIVKLFLRLVVEVFLVWADGLQQLQYVVWIQSAGLGGHAAGQVRVANVRYILIIKKGKYIISTFYIGFILFATRTWGNAHLVNVQLSRPGGLNVAPSLRSQIHHHRALLHRVHKLLLDQNGGPFSCMGTRKQELIQIKDAFINFWPLDGKKNHQNKLTCTQPWLNL